MTTTPVVIGGPGLNHQVKSAFFTIKPRLSHLDPLAEAALELTSNEFLIRRKRQADEDEEDYPFPDVVQEFTAYVREAGISNDISMLAAQINKSGLDDTVRQILSTKGIFEYLVIVALTDQKVKAADLKGMQHAVLLNFEGGPTLDDERKSPKGFFYKSLVDEFLAQTKSGINAASPLYARLIDDVRRANVPITAGKTQPAIVSILDRVRTEGDIPSYIELYAAKGEIPLAKFTKAVKTAMVKYLLGLDLPFESPNFLQDFNNGKYDEYFADAYYHATTVSITGQDPLAAKYSKGNVAEWDFSVDQFDSIVEQGIIPVNIKAAGALYYIYELGEVLGMYKLADAAVLRWANGMLDLTDGDAASKLYQYWKLRDERSSPEERDLIYKRVLNVGEAKVLRHMLANEAYPKLWHKLMEEAAEYIRRSEENSATEEKVSRAKIYEATRNLQYNLTAHMTGMSHLQTQEMHEHLKSAQEILAHPEVVDYFGGGRSKNMWKVIESLWKEDFGDSPNIAAIRTSAVEGNKVFQWIANFDGAGRVVDEDFRAFLESAEAWILAQASVDVKIIADDEDGEEDEEEEDDEEFAEKEDDDFDDWDK